MTLAEALILRADYQTRIEQLKQRILRNARVQEGDDPAEPPAKLLAELERTAQSLLDLIQAINRTNSATLLEGDLTIADALAVRDVLKVKHAAYSSLARAATVVQDRFTKSEVKFQSTVNVSEIQEQADNLAREHRELDAKIQAANWDTELKEK
jgi:hypothetical protein